MIFALLRRWFAVRLLGRVLPGGWILLALSSPWARRALIDAFRRLILRFRP